MSELKKQIFVFRSAGKEFQLEESTLLSLHWRHEHSSNYNKCVSHFLQKTPMLEVVARKGSLCITMKEADMEKAMLELMSPTCSLEKLEGLTPRAVLRGAGRSGVFSLYTADQEIQVLQA